MLAHLSRYFDTVREGTALEPMRIASGQLMAVLEDFLASIGERHPMYGVEAGSSIATRQRLIRWLEEQVGALCDALGKMPDAPSHVATLRTSLCEGVDAVLLSMVHGLEAGDEELWTYTRELAGDRSELMRTMRISVWNTVEPRDSPLRAHVVTATNSVEHILFLIRGPALPPRCGRTPRRPGGPSSQQHEDGVAGPAGSGPGRAGSRAPPVVSPAAPGSCAAPRRQVGTEGRRAGRRCPHPEDEDRVGGRATRTLAASG